LLRDVVEDDDGVGDIVVVLAALREEEEEEEEDGLEFSIFHATNTRGPPQQLTKRERKMYLSSSFSRSLSVDRD
jgi:hypothetical protein